MAKSTDDSQFISRLLPGATEQAGTSQTGARTRVWLDRGIVGVWACPELSKLLPPDHCAASCVGRDCRLEPSTPGTSNAASSHRLIQSVACYVPSGHSVASEGACQAQRPQGKSLHRTTMFWRPHASPTLHGLNTVKVTRSAPSVPFLRDGPGLFLRLPRRSAAQSSLPLPG